MLEEYKHTGQLNLKEKVQTANCGTNSKAQTALIKKCEKQIHLYNRFVHPLFF